MVRVYVHSLLGHPLTAQWIALRVAAVRPFCPRLLVHSLDEHLGVGNGLGAPDRTGSSAAFWLASGPAVFANATMEPRNAPSCVMCKLRGPYKKRTIA